MLTKIIDIRNSMQQVARYVRDTSDNELIETLYGDEFEVAYTADDLAIANPKRRGKREAVVGMMAIISPDPAENSLTKEQELQLLEDFKAEYKTGDRPVSMTKHTKHDGTSHYHLLVSDRDSRGRRLDINKNYQRNEKLSRTWEVAFGHAINKGRHNKAVVENLSINGNGEIAEQLEEAGIDKGELPKQAFSKGLQGKAKKLGIDLPQLHRVLIEGTKDKQNLLENLSSELGQLGLVISTGKKEGHLIIENTSGEFLGGLDRMAKITTAEMKNLRKEIENGHSTKHISEYRKERNRTDEKPENINNQQQYSKELVEYLKSRHNTIKQRERNNRNEKEKTNSKNSNSKIDFKRNQQDNNPRNSEKSGDDSRDQTNSSELPRTVRSRAEPRRAEQDRRTAGADSPGTTSNERTSDGSRAKPDRSNQYLQAIQQRIKNAKFRNSGKKQYYGHYGSLSQISETPPADFPVLESQDVNSFLKRWSQSTKIGMGM